MILERVSITDFRGYARLSLELGGSLTVLTGGNAQGKTNLLRAVEWLGFGDAREPASSQVRFGASRALVEGGTEDGGVRERLAVALAAGGGTRRALNGKSVPRSRWAGRLPVLFMGPEDREQVTGPPSARRALLDELLEQCEPAYLKAMSAYRRALRQRNRALERPDALPEEIEIWEEPLAAEGGVILFHRRRVLAVLSPRAAAWCRELAGSGSELSVEYMSGLDTGGSASPEECSRALREALACARERERAAGVTSVGPHRDEVGIGLDGHALKGAGSSGEIWTAILALTLASAEHLGERLGRLPLLLMDDVLTWLDDARQGRLLAVLAGMPQVLLAATHVPAGVPAREVYVVRDHVLVRTAPASPPAGKEDAWARDPARCVRC